jgi:hypothetical protein
LIRKEITRLLKAVVNLAFDFGLDSIELISILREESIRRAVERQSVQGGRVSISRLSAVTGISRAEISALINSKARANSKKSRQENVLNRILKAWRCDDRFLLRRRPKSLDLFGKAASFDLLVKTYGRGLPTRALFDELLSVGAITVCSSGKVVLKKSFAGHDRAARSDIQASMGKIIELLVELSGDPITSEVKTDSGRRRNFKRDC